MTPLISVPRLAARLGLERLWIKEEGVNPTGSFKARGLCLAVSRALELGAKEVALPTAGNAGSAAAAYSAAAGIACHVAAPKKTPPAILGEIRALGAELTLVDGDITDAGKVIAEGVARQGWVDLSTLKEPYRIEGKKTMGYELFEQLGELPDAILYPTGGGTGLIGMWKAFQEMEALGWIQARRPRMISVQAAGCAPIVRAFEEGSESATPWKDPATAAAGLKVPRAIGDFLMLRALRESKGSAVAVPDPALLEMISVVGRTTGVFVSPEGAATAAAVPELLKRGVLSREDRVVLFNTGSGLKYAS